MLWGFPSGNRNKILLWVCYLGWCTYHLSGKWLIPEASRWSFHQHGDSTSYWVYLLECTLYIICIYNVHYNVYIIYIMYIIYTHRYTYIYTYIYYILALYWPVVSLDPLSEEFRSRLYHLISIALTQPHFWCRDQHKLRKLDGFLFPVPSHPNKCSLVPLG